MTSWVPTNDPPPPDDHHTWARPVNPACPHCDCCTEALCRKAVDQHGACHHFSDNNDFDLAGCPCWRRGSTFRQATNIENSSSPPKEPS